MAALMRSARFCSPAVQIAKFLRVASSGTSQSAAGLFTSERSSFQQRCWRSTAVEGAQAASLAPSKLEVMMNTIERYVRQFGRISRKQLDPVVQCLEREGSISMSNSLTLLRLYGTTLFDEPPANRLKMAEELWETYKKHGISLDVMHYNTLLAVYNMNKLNFSPTEFLAKMEANGIAPNRITYQRLIARFCEDGDIPGATQVLEHMKAASLPINDHVFNSFITGHLRANDPDNARNIVEVMRQTGLDPTNMTYTVMAIGFAERGEIEEVKKYISQAEIENVPLRPGQFLDVYVTLAVSGHSDQLPELFPFLHSGTPFNQDAIRVCNQLIAAGYDDAAYTLFLQMPKPSRLDADQTTLGRFFLRALARHQRPVEKVVELVKDMQKREVNKDDLSAVAHLAFLESQPAYALSLLEKMKEEGLPIRAHYFWPAVCQFRDAKNMEGVYEVMEKMGKLCDTRDDFIQTLHSYTIPALEELGQTQDEIIDNLKTRDFKAEDIHFALFLSLLEKFKLKEALAFLESHSVSVNMGPVRACALSLIGKDMDWRLMLQIMSQLKQQSVSWRGPAMEATAIVLRQILTTQRKADWADTKDIFAFMKENNLRILKRSHTEMSEYYGGAPAEVLQGLKDLVSTDRAASEGYSGDMVSSETSLEELKQLSKDRPDNKSVLKRLLIKACSVGDVEEAERVRGVLEGMGFVFPPIMLVQLAYLYAAFVKDLDRASSYLQQLEDTFPEHQNYQTLVLKMTALLAASGNTEAAVERLKKFAERHASVVKTQEVKREENYSDILHSATDEQAAKQLMTTLTTYGYLPASSPLLLNSYMDKVLDSGESERILKEFEEMVKTHKCSPQVDKVLQFFINKEDPESLQKVVDLLTEVHGLMNVLHHLIADLIQCGHVKKARKIMETPGLRANMQRLNYFCQSFIEKNMIKELEMLVELTKDMFAVDRDNMLFHLMRGYVKRKELDKAQDVLLQFEEEMLQPSARTLRFLARSLQAAGLPVPFDVPEFQAPVERAERRQARGKGDMAETASATGAVAAAATAATASKRTPAAKSAPQASPAASQLKDMLDRGEVQQALTTLKSDKSVLAQAITLMKKPWPSEALQSVFKSLADEGDLDTLSSMDELRLPMGLRNNLKSYVFTAAVNSGRGEEVIDRIEATTNNSARYLTLEGLKHLNTTTPHLMDKLENVLRKLKIEKNYTEPLSILWCYYKYNNSSRAEQIMKEVPDFDKAVLAGTLCQAAVKDNKADVLESLLQLKQGAGEKRGMAVAYSGLLQLHVAQKDVEAVQRTCERIVADNVLRSELRTNAVRKTEEFLQEKSQPAPAWGAEDSSASSDSASSSDDEKPVQRS